MNEPADIDEAAKAFELLGLVPVNKERSYTALRSFLSQRINKMILDEFETLVHLLYRIDIPEQKLKSVLQTNSNENAGNIIAELMIERQLRKIATRKSFGKSGDISEEERW